MTFDITISLSQVTYERIKKWAELRQQNVTDVIEEYLEDNLPAIESLGIPPSEPDPAVARERDAYLRLYPHLKEKYAGHYIAIYGGKLVDHDLDEVALFTRIDTQYPDKFVWITQITDTVEREIHLYSARFEPDTS